MEQQRTKMAPWKPSDDFLQKSQARLNAVFEDNFTQIQASREQQQPLQEATSNLLRNLAGEDKSIGQLVKDTRQRSVDRTQKPRLSPEMRKVVPLGSINEIFVPPYTWSWTWDAHSGQDATASASANATNGTMTFTIDSGANGKAASAAVAVGSYFRPTISNGIMDVSSNPSFNFEGWADNVFDSSHTHTFIGLYVGEYTLGGEFVQAVVDQSITVEDSTGGQPEGSNSGFPLFASVPIDGDHFYEIWVWVGGDCEGDGWSIFWGSEAGAYMNIFVPSISVHVY